MGSQPQQDAVHTRCSSVCKHPAGDLCLHEANFLHQQAAAQKPKVVPKVEPPPGTPRSSLSKKRKAAQLETAASRGFLPPSPPPPLLPQAHAAALDTSHGCVSRHVSSGSFTRTDVRCVNHAVNRASLANTRIRL